MKRWDNNLKEKVIFLMIHSVQCMWDFLPSRKTFKCQELQQLQNLFQYICLNFLYYFFFFFFSLFRTTYCDQWGSTYTGMQSIELCNIENPTDRRKYYVTCAFSAQALHEILICPVGNRWRGANFSTLHD